MWQRLAHIVVGVVFVLAAVQKGVDDRDLVAVLRFDRLPMTMIQILRWLIPLIELLVGMSLILNIKPSVVRVVVISVLLVFSGQLAILLTAKNPPNCGCLKLWQAYESGRSAAAWGLARNAILLAVLLLPGWLPQVLRARIGNAASDSERLGSPI